MFILCFHSPANAKIDLVKEIKDVVKDQNASVYVTDPKGNPIIAINEGVKLAPASILKIVTASAAYHYLKDDFRFLTEFYLDDANNLYIKGYGDPLLISEELDLISTFFKENGIVKINSIFLDNSYFAKDIKIDGVENSLNPYDATNGALCVNFNTVMIKITSSSKVISAEEQTPMTDYARDLVKKSGFKSKNKKERLILSHEKDETLYYTGHLFKKFLTMEGIKVSGTIKKKMLPKSGVKLIKKHFSSKSLNDVVSSMMKYSNNFTA
ncbi:D-alanyl-D-alanine carboxypeptidase, partial [Thermodesulfobacteriota bacterium]